MPGASANIGPEEGAVGDRLVLVQDIVASPDSVWKCLTEPDCFKSWWRDDLEFEPKLGGRFLEPWKDPQGRLRTTHARVTAYHLRRGFVMIWTDEEWTFDTVVSVTLEPRGRGTRVTIEHQGWQAAPAAERTALWLDHRDGWSAHAASLAAHAQEHDARRKGH